MPQGKEVFIGLNQNGLIVFLILVLFCLPLCWIPFLIDSLKKSVPIWKKEFATTGAYWVEENP